jgi:L-aminopeptidase/D-esterase-like protein
VAAVPEPVRGGVRDLLSVRGLSVGHSADPEGRTGVTAILFDEGAPTVVDVRGGASGTYDTASLSLDATFGRRWAIFFAGGSLFGLDAARGIRLRLLEEGRGVRAFGNRRPIVPISGAVIFDLPRDDRPLPDYATLGYDAAAAAGRRALAQGQVGAGAGASVGKYLGRSAAMAGGLGSSARPLGNGSVVGVLVVVNSAGAVRDPGTGRWVAAARGRGGRLVPPSDLPRRRLAGRGTTVAIVATDLALSRPALARVAAIVHAGLARTIVPYLTSTDGDCVFAATTAAGEPPRREAWPGASADQVGRLAADAAVEAVLRAVRPRGA